MTEDIVQYEFYLAIMAVQDFVIDGIYGIRYVFRVGRAFNNVVRDKNKLVGNLDLVQQKVETTDLKTEKVNDAVIEWLKQSNILIQEVENPKIKPRPRSWREYREMRTEQAIVYFNELLRKITALNIECEFDEVSTRIPSLEHFSKGNIMCFKSTDEASDELLRALQDDNCSIVGLFGRHNCVGVLRPIIEGVINPLHLFS